MKYAYYYIVRKKQYVKWVGCLVGRKPTVASTIVNFKYVVIVLPLKLSVDKLDLHVAGNVVKTKTNQSLGRTQQNPFLINQQSKYVFIVNVYGG